MRDLAVITFLTLDGVMQAPVHPDEDRSGGFQHGGWAAPYFDEVMEQVNEHAMVAPIDFVFGRKTYELFAGHWPNVSNDNPHAKLLNSSRKYVVTSTLDGLEWNNAEAVSGDVVSEIGRLKQQPGPLLQVHGSWQLIRSLIAHDLVDEFRLWTFPVVAGGGKRLFDQMSGKAALSLIKSGACANGVSMTIYRRDR